MYTHIKKIRLYVLVMSRTRLRVNPHSIVAKWLSVRLITKWFWVRVQLQRKLASAKVLYGKAFKSQNAQYDGYKRGIGTVVNKCFDENLSGESVFIQLKQNEQSPDDL